MNIPFTGKKQRVELSEQLDDLTQVVKEATHLIYAIQNGELETEPSEALRDHALGEALVSMRNALQQVAQQEEDRNWLTNGLNEFADILRNKDSLGLDDLTHQILSRLVRHVGALQGAIFFLEEQDGESYLNQVACYAYSRQKFMEQRIELGEGLAGQCVLERAPIYLTDIPKDFATISSGLGDSQPRAVFLTPLMVNEEVWGVLELAALDGIPEHKREFVLRLSENIAASVRNVKESERNLRLLEESQEQAQQLRAQEEEMRQNTEELQATHEEMERRTKAIEDTNAELQGVLEGIDATMATIEFEPDGTIIKANQKFMDAMEVTQQMITGTHHRRFVTEEEANSEAYQQFWQDRAAGHPATGTYLRMTATGKPVWLQAIYNPIFNAKGAVVRVIKFAVDVSNEKEAIAKTRGIVEAINATMATIEFDTDGTILEANDNFLKTMKVNLKDIEGTHHRRFVPEDQKKTAAYQTFWAERAAGKAASGTFRRLAADGSEVWLNALYHPLLDANGQITRIVKFATVTNAPTEAPSVSEASQAEG